MTGQQRWIDRMSPLELAAVLLGLANVGLLVRRSIWNYPAGMAMVSLYALIFFQARLYSEAGLQLFFFVVQIYGWVLWYRQGGQQNPVDVNWMSARQRGMWSVGTAILSLSLGWLMHRFTNAALPFADSAVTGASIAAQFLLSFRRIENWILWIVIDLASIALYINRDLLLTAGLYVILLGLSAMGLREWMQAARHEPRAA
jgi:nicotinamide mononucleotide transporter